MQFKIALFVFLLVFVASCKSLIYYPNAVLEGDRYDVRIHFFKNKTCQIGYGQKRHLDHESFFAVEAHYKVQKIHKKHWIISFYATQAEKDYLQELKNTDTVEYNYRKNLLPDGLQADYFPHSERTPLPIQLKYRNTVLGIHGKGHLLITDTAFIQHLYYYDCAEIDRYCQKKFFCTEVLDFYTELPHPKNPKWDLFHGMELTDLIGCPEVIEHFDIRTCDEGERGR